ncbi:MAG TPA: tetratricopeptide repeat protein [Spirochaetales bacterium]|nr:tetratricopeptide repeat protein [Spirochaetales bacterium]
MMPLMLITLIILGTGIGFLIFFLIRSIVIPQKIATLEKLVKQNRTASAIRMARKLITKNPRNVDAHYFLGLAYLADNKPELALMELKTVNSIGQFTDSCREIPFRRKIAELYTKFNQPEEALKEYLLLVRKEPNQPEYPFLIGQLFEERGKGAKAVEFYRKALELDPKNWKAFFHMGMVLYRTKKPAESRESLEASLKLNPENYAAHFYLGRLFKENHEYTPALAAFEKAQKDPAYKTKALIERGTCYMSMNNFEKAASELERAIKLAREGEENELLYAHYFLAHCYEKMRELEQAIEHWETIYTRKPNFKDVAEKLTQYQEFRQDDHVKDFMTAGRENFLEQCKNVATALGLTVQDVTDIPNGCQILGVEAQSKWRNARKIPKLLRFLRTTEPIDESAVRSLHEEMKQLNVTRGIVLTSSSFSRLALEFAESRPIELIGKEKLLELLKSIPREPVHRD